MPNAAGRTATKSRKAATNGSNPHTVPDATDNTPDTDNNAKDSDMTTATAPTYDIASIGSLGDYEFKRSGAGRKRVPSPFDEVVETMVGAGTKFLPVADDAAGKTAIEDLQKACNWDRGRSNFKGYGLTKRLTRLDGVEGVADGLYVIFEVKATKETRVRKPKANPDAEVPSAVDQDAAETE